MGLLSIVTPPGLSPMEDAWGPAFVILMALAASSLLLYRRSSRLQSELSRVSQVLSSRPRGPSAGTPLRARTRSPHLPTAVLLVEGYDVAGMESLLAIGRLLPGGFGRIVILALRPFDPPDGERRDEAAGFRSSLEQSLEKYFPVADLLDLSPEARVILGPDPVALGIEACRDLSRTRGRVVLVSTSVLLPAGPAPDLASNRVSRAVAEGVRRHGMAAVELPLAVTLPRVARRATSARRGAAGPSSPGRPA